MHKRMFHRNWKITAQWERLARVKPVAVVRGIVTYA